jgi:outer membrane protein
MDGTMTRPALGSLLLSLLPLMVLPEVALTQAPPAPPAQLSLADALALARDHNPAYRAQLGEESVAAWGVRSAYASLLPTASVSGGVAYQGGGQARLGNFTADDIGLGTTPSYYFSSYAVNVSLGLDGTSYYRIGQEKAQRDVVLARLDAAEQSLRANVTRQYLSALRARDAVALAEAELSRTEANLSLAEARRAVESATLLEVKQAQVERGRAEVELLRGRSTEETERIRLLQLIGLELDGQVELTSEVQVFEPRWESEQLARIAMGMQPHLEVARATETAARAEVGMARSAFWPRFSATTGVSGFTRRVGSDQYLLDQAERSLRSAREDCMAVNELLTRLNPPLPPQDCSSLVFTDELRSRILDDNRQFPFNFHNEPVSVSLGVSVPVFQGLNRQRQLEAAHVNQVAARQRLRGEELRIRADVLASLASLRAAYQAVLLEERNRELADDQLQLARERYRVGAASFIELMEAETMKARADRAHLLGVYTFQEYLTALESAVGQELPHPNH